MSEDAAKMLAQLSAMFEADGGDGANGETIFVDMDHLTGAGLDWRELEIQGTFSQVPVAAVAPPVS